MNSQSPSLYLFDRLNTTCRLLMGLYLVIVAVLDAAAQTSVIAWGDNSRGQSTVPAGLGEVVAVAAGHEHSLALKADGTVVAWGDNTANQCAVPEGLDEVIAISAGYEHCLALQADGTVVAWGNQMENQTVIPDDLFSVIAISAGQRHSMALRSDGTVVEWGQNGNRVRPVPAGLSGVVAIAAGHDLSLALKADGTVTAWGGKAEELSAVLPGLSNVAGLAVGSAFSLSLHPDGTVATWGGDGGFEHQLIEGLSGVAAIAVFAGNPLVLRTDGSVSLIEGFFFIDSPVPVGLSGVSAISAGDGHALALSGGGVPVISTSRQWTTEAAGARSGNVRFYQRIMATGSPDSYTAAGLPPGLVLDSATGVISGAATAPGNFTVAVSATNSMGTGTSVISLTVTGQPRLLETPPAVVQSGQQVAIYSLGQVSISGLPAGAELDTSTGRITGLVHAGNYQAVITIANLYGSVSVPWNFEITGVRIWGSDKAGLGSLPSGLGQVVAVAGGGYHSLALTVDGFVFAWGNNDEGQSTVPVDLSGVIAIAAGEMHSLALKADGTVVGWGWNGSGASTVPENPGHVVAIAAGGTHSLALRSDGTVTAWGGSYHGDNYVPAGLSGVIAVAAGEYHSMALKADGTVVGWTTNPDLPQSTVPAGLSGVVAIAAGGMQSLALKTDGTVVGWGREAPAGLGEVIAIAAGGGHSLALTAGGNVVAWGDNAVEQSSVPADLNGVGAIAAGGQHSLALTGHGVPRIFSSPHWMTEAAGAGAGAVRFFQRIYATGSPSSYAATGLPPGLSLDSVTGIISGAATALGTYTVFLSATNSVGTGTASVTLTVTGSPKWLTPLPAYLRSGQQIQIHAVGQVSVLGLPDEAVFDSSSGTISGLWRAGLYEVVFHVTNRYGSISVPWNFEISSLYGWGHTYYGLPELQTGLVSFIDIAVGISHSMALRADGSVLTWGNGMDGQSISPDGLTGVVAIAAGEYHSLALHADGTVTGWGSDSAGRSRVPAGLSGVVAIAAGGIVSIALKADGQVVTWGDPGITVPEGLRNVIAVSAGNSHFLALKADGTVVAWGLNYGGATNVPGGLGGVVAIAAGYRNSLALKADGTVVAWGENATGNSTVPSGLSGVVSIAAGRWHSLALKADGTVTAWGWITSGSAAIPRGLSGIRFIATKGDHSLALGEALPGKVTRPPGQPVQYLALPRVSLAQFSAVNLPPGLSIHPTSGVVSGTCQEAGSWLATITSANALVSRTETVSFVIAPLAFPGFAEYGAHYWPEGGVHSQASGDADGDGVANIMEFALGTDPVIRSAQPSVAAGRDAGGHLVLEIQAADRGAAVAWKAQFSSSLNFAGAVEVVPEVIPGAPVGYVHLRFPDAAAFPGSSRFGRLVVAEP